MRQRDIAVDSIERGFELLRPALKGRVFHVTTQRAWERIQRAGGIAPNSENQLEPGFGSSANSFFRNRGCVSLFDFRTATNEQIDESLCFPFEIIRPDRPGVVLLISPELNSALIDWTEWERTHAWKEMIVPYIECGHPGTIPLTRIDEAILISVEASAGKDSLEAMIAQSWEI